MNAMHGMLRHGMLRHAHALLCHGMLRQCRAMHGMLRHVIDSLAPPPTPPIAPSRRTRVKGVAPCPPSSASPFRRSPGGHRDASVADRLGGQRVYERPIGPVLSRHARVQCDAMQCHVTPTKCKLLHAIPHVAATRGNVKARPWHSVALHCIAPHCVALHCTAWHCIATQCIALPRSALYWIYTHCIPLHCFALHCTTMHRNALHCNALHISLRGAAHCIARRGTTRRTHNTCHCIALRGIA